MKVKLKKVRGAFLNLFEAKAFEDNEPKFSGCFIMEPTGENVKAMRKAVAEVAKEEWGKKTMPLKKGKETVQVPVLEYLEASDRVCYREGPKTNASGEIFEGFEDMYYVSATNKRRPSIFDRDKTPLTEADGKPYSGCYVNVVLDLWPQDHPKFGKRINATVTGVQFHSDGDGFGGGAPASENDFDDLGVDEDNDDII